MRSTDGRMSNRFAGMNPLGAFTVNTVVRRYFFFADLKPLIYLFCSQWETTKKLVNHNVPRQFRSEKWSQSLNFFDKKQSYRLLILWIKKGIAALVCIGKREILRKDRSRC